MEDTKLAATSLLYEPRNSSLRTPYYVLVARLTDLHV